jgi:fructose-1-phosphate kinase PfkB-like protein
MQISNLALIKLMKVLKNNLAKNDIFVISGYGPFIFICPSKYGLNMA